MKIKKLEIIVETYECLIIKQVGKREIPCAECGQTVEAMKPEDAAIEFSTSVRLLYQWVESGKLHFTECPDRSILICHNSLQKLFNLKGEKL